MTGDEDVKNTQVFKSHETICRMLLALPGFTGC